MFDILMILIALATGGGESGKAQMGAEGGVADPMIASSEDPPPNALASATPDADPSPYVAEQQVPTGRFTTAVEVKPILNATRGNWIAVREFNGQDLVYVTHLWSWRCGLVAMKFAINGGELQEWPLPKCHDDTNAPNAILQDDGLPYREFPLGSVETVSVELIFDDLSTDGATFNRAGAMIP
jgi:hypothetical protein